MIIGERIQRLRKSKGWTQKELAEELGLATGTVQQYELGKRSPSLDTLKNIAEVLDIPIGNLLEENFTEPNDQIYLDLSEFYTSYDIEHSENQIETYFRAIKIGSEEKSFTLEETANIKKHFAELLLRYKLAINAVANIEMNSAELQNDLKLASQSGSKSLLSESKIREEYFKKYAEKELMDLKNWAANLAWYIAQSREDKTSSEGE